MRVSAAQLLAQRRHLRAALRGERGRGARPAGRRRDRRGLRGAVIGGGGYVSVHHRGEEFCHKRVRGRGQHQLHVGMQDRAGFLQHARRFVVNASRVVVQLEAPLLLLAGAKRLGGEVRVLLVGQPQLVQEVVGGPAGSTDLVVHHCKHPGGPPLQHLQDGGVVVASDALHLDALGVVLGHLGVEHVFVEERVQALVAVVDA
mmetsp:Transcript_28700/g.54987  ORF Transcript_28700/g.54987 Transcript_28700/m.54987 type:complete len:202 (-) Transcript_28700:1288-1893(-)